MEGSPVGRMAARVGGYGAGGVGGVAGVGEEEAGDEFAGGVPFGEGPRRAEEERDPTGREVME